MESVKLKECLARLWTDSYYRLRFLGWMALATVALTVAACGPKKISYILADPHRYSNQDVSVEGSVTESYGVLGNGAYQVDDGTGKLWIVSQHGVPRQGARVSAKGKIKEGFNFGSMVRLPKNLDSGVVMIESSHKAKE